MIPVVFALFFCQTLGQLSLPAHFNWTDCGPYDRLIHIQYFKIIPVPIRLPGIINLSLEGSIAGTLGRDFTIEANVKKWTLAHWSNVPCFHNVGSCHYDDPMGILADVESSCGSQRILGLQCFLAKTFLSPEKLHISNERFNVTHIADSYTRFVEGSYRYHLEVKKAGKIIGCLQADITLTTATSSGFLFGFTPGMID